MRGNDHVNSGEINQRLGKIYKSFDLWIIRSRSGQYRVTELIVCHILQEKR